MIPLLVGLGAAVGAPARYLADRAVQRRHDTPFPWGTLSVNIVASLVLGLVAGLAPSSGVSALVGTGFCGALSTYSTFSYETVRLLEERGRFHGMANIAVSLFAGLGAAGLGYAIGRGLAT